MMVLFPTFYPEMEAGCKGETALDGWLGWVSELSILYRIDHMF